jgi:type IV secretory pathway VirB2 component (pilin)
MRKLYAYLTTLLLTAPVFAYDTNKAAYLGDVWNNIKDILQGTGGLIIAGLMLLVGGYMVFRGSWIWGMVVIAAAVIVKAIPNIAEGMGFVF